MDNAIISNWNRVVKNDDIVYFLGDFAFANEKSIADLLFELKGNIKILFGNHDKTLRKFASKDFGSYIYHKLHNRIEFLGDYKEINILGQPITLTHYAMRVWNGSHRWSWNLFGHSHNSLPDDPNSLSLDVGVDCHNFTPINFKQVGAIMAKKTPKKNARL
jgi:calcineurin-like phosphoesterase family protein